MKELSAAPKQGQDVLTTATDSMDIRRPFQWHGVTHYRFFVEPLNGLNPTTSLGHFMDGECQMRSPISPRPH
jgi:hypothetical protein